MKTIQKTILAGAMALGSVVCMGAAEACCDPMVELAQVWQSIKSSLEVKPAAVNVSTMPVMNMDLENVQPHQTTLQLLGRKTVNKLMEIGVPPAGFNLKKLNSPKPALLHHGRH